MWGANTCSFQITSFPLELNNRHCLQLGNILIDTHYRSPISFSRLYYANYSFPVPGKIKLTLICLKKEE